jgi:Domain of unknown function (DUF6908)
VRNIIRILEMAQKAGKEIAPGLCIKIENAGYLTLVIEHIGNVAPGGFPAISVAHYGELNGDPMRDPEMCFHLEIDQWGKMRMFPYSFRNDYVGVDRTSKWEEDKKVFVHRGRYSDDLDFALVWNRNIGDQGFVAAYEKQLKGWLEGVCLCGAPMPNGVCSIPDCVCSSRQKEGI